MTRTHIQNALLNSGFDEPQPGKPVVVDGLKVYPPSQRSPKEIGFAFDACAHTGVLVVGPMRAGVGIPGYTGP